MVKFAETMPKDVFIKQMESDIIQMKVKDLQ